MAAPERRPGAPTGYHGDRRKSLASRRAWRPGRNFGTSTDYKWRLPRKSARGARFARLARALLPRAVSGAPARPTAQPHEKNARGQSGLRPNVGRWELTRKCARAPPLMVSLRPRLRAFRSRVWSAVPYMPPLFDAFAARGRRIHVALLDAGAEDEWDRRAPIVIDPRLARPNCE